MKPGHGIVARVLGLSVVSLGVAGDGSGQAAIGCAAHLPITDQIAICVAGTQAASLLGRSLRQAGYRDHAEVYELLKSCPEADHERLRREGYRRARRILKDHRPALARIATKLAQMKTMDGAAFEAALNDG